MMKTYTAMIKLPTFEERFEYLKLGGFVGEETFGFDRYLNQVLYKSCDWKQIRRHVIARDFGCDLACRDREIGGRIIVHHMNPITLSDINERSAKVLDPEGLVSVSIDTHNAIHYGDISLALPSNIIVRAPNDTSPWKQTR